MQCPICEKGCIIPESKPGACGRYMNDRGTIKELHPDSYLIACPISAETIPVLHFHPKAKFLQISTTGCNFDCPGCVATVVAREMDSNSRALRKLTPLQVVQKALAEQCDGIVFMMNDPLASYYSFLETAKTAKKHALLVGCSSNGYFTERSADQIAPYLDFINVGIKGLSDTDYSRCGVAGHKPVIRNIRYFHNQGIHVEVACIHKKGEDGKLLDIASAIAGISKEIPLQIMRYIPLDRASIAEEPSIRESEQAQKKTLDILHYTYLFNSPGTNCINTYCPKCGELIYERDFYGPMGSKLRGSAIKANENRCPKCGHQLPVTGSVAARTFNENDFEGGYPFTRALEIIEGTLAAISVRDRKSIVKCWESVLQKDGLQKLHGNIQDFQKYAGSIRHFAALTGREHEAEELVAYLRERVEDIREKARRTEKRPRTYYVMGTPLFSLEYQRLENTLVELAGGTSINEALAGTGRPGMKVSPEQVNGHNPEVIFISSFMQSPLDEFYHSCTELGITAEAVTKRRIHTPPIPCTDFGSPRWILGLMYIANCLHPETFSFDIETEAKAFYRKFYDLEFCLADVNRSFAKPSRRWQTVP